MINLKDYDFKEDKYIQLFSDWDNKLWGAVYTKISSDIEDSEYEWLPEYWDIQTGLAYQDELNNLKKSYWYNDESIFPIALINDEDYIRIAIEYDEVSNKLIFSNDADDEPNGWIPIDYTSRYGKITDSSITFNSGQLHIKNHINNIHFSGTTTGETE